MSQSGAAMFDVSEVVGVGLGSSVVGGIVMKLLSLSASRNLHQLDDTLKQLAASITELGRDIRTLRETDIAQAKDIGALQADVRALTARVDGQGNYWRGQFEAVCEPRRLKQFTEGDR